MGAGVGAGAAVGSMVTSPTVIVLATPSPSGVAALAELFGRSSALSRKPLAPVSAIAGSALRARLGRRRAWEGEGFIELPPSMFVMDVGGVYAGPLEPVACGLKEAFGAAQNGDPISNIRDRPTQR